MKKIMMLSVCVMATHLFAQNPIEVSLWPGGAPNSNGLEGKERELENGRIENVVEPTITVFPSSAPNSATIIMCPGGGYARLAMNHEGFDMAPWFHAQGITYVILKYRMPNGNHEVPLADAEQAIRLVRRHANQWNVNPQRVGIMGASAGGHLASTLATQYGSEETRPDFQILLYPVITMSPNTHEGSRSNLLGAHPSEELMKKYSNELQITGQTPKAFITLSSDDRSVVPQNGVDYYLALVRNNVPAALHIYATGGHGWGFRDNFIYKRQWTGELEKWLREEVGVSPMIANGLSMLGTPYVANTLERTGQEELFANRSELDCTTFVESAMAMSLSTTEDDFARNLQKIRYRNGLIDGYPSRLHYVADWINDNIQKGIIEDITSIHSTEKDTLRIFYMSKNPDKYKHLKNNPQNVTRMAGYEKALTGREIYWFPKNKLPDTGMAWIKDGDIIMLTTNIAGLDVVHAGIAIYQNKNLHLLHASSIEKKVIVDKHTLRQQLLQSKHITGIRVLRLIR